MSTYIKVARYHMVTRLLYVALPWAVLAFSFLVNVAIRVMVGTGPGVSYTGGLAAFYIEVLVCGVLSVAKFLPFGLSLGVSRRSFYLGTGLLAVALGMVYGLGLAMLQVVERATGGWGVNMGFFRVPYFLDGPWYVTWLTSFVVLTLMFVYGMWYGLVFRRWNLVGLLSFEAAQVTVLLAGSLVATEAQAWGSIGNFFTTLSAPGLTGVLAVLTAALLVGGLSTMRRVTV
ncbi:MAG: ABC transporter permease [Acidimicrobiales bacterium]